MKIGIDARSLIGNRRGVGHSLAEILNMLGRLDLTNEYYLYSHKEINFDRPNERWHIKIGKGLLSKIGSLWLQTQGHRMIVNDELDIFWGTEQILPLYLPNRIKKLLTIHDLVWLYYPETMGIFNLLTHKILVKPSIAQADKIICVSNSTAASLAASLAVKLDKLRVMYWGVDQNRFKPRNSTNIENIEIKKKYGLGDDYILYLGTIEPRKNLERLLNAFKVFKEKGGREKLVIAGGLGWKMNDFFGKINFLGLMHEVIMTGYVPENEKVLLIQNAKVFVFPSLYEGFGLPVLEAMACGVPVITSNNSSLAEIGEDCSILIDPLNIGEITSAMIDLSENDGLRSALIKKGIQKAGAMSWDSSARAFMDICAKARVN